MGHTKAAYRRINRRLTKLRGGEVAVYQVVGPDGYVKYIGSSNNPRFRAVEHLESGKVAMGDVIHIIGRYKTRHAAEAAEETAIRRFRNTHGRNPPGNMTRDGRGRSQ